MKLSDPALDTLRRLVSQYVQADMSELQTLAGLMSERRVARGDILLRAGTQAENAGIVVEGVVGEFYESASGQRKAKWLAGPGAVFGSLEDLVRGGPAHATIQALADSLVLYLPYSRLRQLAMTQLLWSRLFISMVEDHYRRKSEREYSLLMLKAEERYHWFHQHYAHLEARLSLETIASYLGITPVHLSRIRAAGNARPAADA